MPLEKNQFTEIYDNPHDANLDLIPALIWQSDKDGNVVFVNQNWIDFVGSPFEKEIGDGWTRHIHPDDVGTLHIQFSESIENHTLYNPIARFKRHDGIYRTMQVIAKPMFKNNEYIGHIGVDFDITEEKNIGNQLKESEEHYRLLFDNMPICIHEISLDGKIISINKTGLNILGLNNESEIIGKTFLDLISSEDLNRIRNLMNEAINKSKFSEFEFRVNTKKTKYFLSNFVPIKDSAEKVIKLMGTSQNITERVLSEQQLKNSKDQLRQVIDLVPHMIFAKDKKGRLLLSNKAVADAYSTTVDKIIGKYHAELHPNKKEVEKMLKDDLEVITNKKPKYIPEETYLNEDGSISILQTTKIPFTSLDGNQEAMLGVAIDITEHKKTLEKLMKSNAELERFAYICSHDLKEPLRNVTSLMQLFKKSAGNNLCSESSDYMKLIAKNVERMSDLVSDILEYSRLESGRLKKEDINLNELCTYIESSLSTTIKSTNANLTIDKLPNIYANRSQIIQLLQNLICNALEFTTEKPSIHIGYKKQKNNLVFFIKDNGIGIKPEYHSQIFNIFERLNSRNEFSGTGIGLAICRKVIEQHDGKIWIESEFGKGSTFFFTIPKNY